MKEAGEGGERGRLCVWVGGVAGEEMESKGRGPTGWSKEEDQGNDPVVRLKDPHRLLPVPNLTPRHYHIIVHKEKGSLFIYAAVIARILLLIACPGFSAAV